MNEPDELGASGAIADLSAARERKLRQQPHQRELASEPGGAQGPTPKPAEALEASAVTTPTAAGAQLATSVSSSGDVDFKEAYRVNLPMFEGPLDLLLHLIQKHELNVLDIPVAFVTEKYLEYLKLMEDVSIDIASEYLVMAATLAHIKSKMLLPRSPDSDEDETAEPEEDPRLELVRRLLEYQKYKQAADELSERRLLGRDVFGRGAPAEQATGPAPLAPLSLFKLLDAFQGVLERTHQLKDHEIDFEQISITERISQLSDVLRARRWLPFEELFIHDTSKEDLIVTFLALLEMTRLRMTELKQVDPLGPILVSLRVWEEAGEEGDGGTHERANVEGLDWSDGEAEQQLEV